MYLSTGIKRRSVFANGQYDFTDNIRGTANVLYTEREALQQIAGYPYRSSAYGTKLSRTVRSTRWTRMSTSCVAREMPRQTKSELNTFRFSAGLEGSFEFGDKYFDWDVGYVYNRNKGTKTGTGNLFIPNVKNAVGPSFVENGVAYCGAPGAVIAGCTPWNPLLGYGIDGAGSLSNPDLQKYLFLPTHDTSLTTSKVYSANLSGALFTLPAGDLSFAAGYEHREEQAEYNPDALLQSGLSTDLAGASTAGGYKLNEFFLELNVPIGRPAVRQGTVGRHGRPLFGLQHLRQHLQQQVRPEVEADR